MFYEWMLFRCTTNVVTLGKLKEMLDISSIVKLDQLKQTEMIVFLWSSLLSKIFGNTCTVKPVYSDHWREFWKRLHKTGSLYIEVMIFAPKISRGKNLVRVYNPYQYLNPFVWKTNAWISSLNSGKKNV